MVEKLEGSMFRNKLIRKYYSPSSKLTSSKKIQLILLNWKFSVTQFQNEINNLYCILISMQGCQCLTQLLTKKLQVRTITK